MRVLFSVGFPGGGIGRYTHLLLNQMVDSGLCVPELLCPPDFEHRQEARYLMHPVNLRLSHPVATLRRARFLASQFVNPVRLCRSARHYSVVHLQNFNHLSWPLWKRNGVWRHTRLVVTAHDVRRRVAIAWRPAEERHLKDLYRACDAIFVHSVDQADDLVAFSGASADRIHVVPHGPTEFAMPSDPGIGIALRRQLGVRDDESLGLFFGVLRPDKRPEIAVRAMASLPVRYKLLIAGQGETRNLMALVDELGLRDRVMIQPGHVPDEQVVPLFRAANWLGLPYAPEFTSQSGVLNIAFAQDCPVATSPCPTVAETVRNSGLGVVATDFSAAAFAEAIRGLDTVDATADAFARAREHSSWQRNVEASVDVYRSLTGTSP